jgi:TorA maturation chaperone TorD
MAEARAAAYALLAHGFRYPDAPWHDLLCDERRWQDWPAILACLHPGLEDSVAALRSRRAGTCNSRDYLAGLQRAYDALFGHAVSGKCPPYETEYGWSEINQRAAQLADLGGFYQAFGLEIAGCESDRPDFVSVECEFMSALCVKEAHGRSTKHHDLIACCTDAQRAFFKDHLSRWMPALASRVIDAAQHPFYDALACFARELITLEGAHLRLAVGPQWVELRPADPEGETSISCLDASNCGPEAGAELTPLNIDVRGG